VSLADPLATGRGLVAVATDIYLTPSNAYAESCMCCISILNLMLSLVMQIKMQRVWSIYIYSLKDVLLPLSGFYEGLLGRSLVLVVGPVYNQ
jgi:hypothetical protein